MVHMPPDTPTSDDAKWYERLESLFESWGMVAPIVPAHVRPYLRSDDGDPLFLSTVGSPLSSWSGYMLGFDEGMSSVPAEYLVDDGPDYFVCAGRDNGYSASWGFAARAGGVFVSMQDTIGAADHNALDPKAETGNEPSRRFGLVFEAYNEYLAPLLNRGTRPLTVGVVCSTFRNELYVVHRDRRGGHRPLVRGDLAPDWTAVVDVADEVGPWVVPQQAGPRQRELRAALTFAAVARSLGGW